MDTQTRHALKKDKFAQATASSMSWLRGHRSGVLRWVIVAVVVLVASVGSLVFWSLRSSAADAALGAALDVYCEEPPTDKEFLNLPHLLCTPHRAGSSREAVLAMGRSAIGHLKKFFLEKA